MDPERFDSLARSLTGPRSRRGVVAALLGGALSLVSRLDAASKKKGNKKKGNKKKGKPAPNVCTSLPRDNVYRLSCRELKQRSDAATMGVWYPDNDGTPTCGLGAHGSTVPRFAFTKTYTAPTPVKQGIAYTATTRDLRATVSANPDVTSVDWVRVGDEADSGNAGCAKLERDFEDYVRSHEARHVADAHAIADEWNRTWTPPSSGYTGRGPDEQAALDALDASIVKALSDQREILKTRQRDRASDYHRSDDEYAKPFQFDCTRCDTCQPGAGRRGGRRLTNPCGQACCGVCQECADPETSLCVAKTCEACEECRDGECIAVDCGDPCLECVENACLPKACDACEECRNGDCVPIDCGGPCFDCIDNACRPKPCGECEECRGGACVPVDCGNPCLECVANACQPKACPDCEACSNGVCSPIDCGGPCFACADNECRPKPCGECQICVDGACVPKPAEAGACSGSNGSCFTTPGRCGLNNSCYCRQAAPGSGKCGNVCVGFLYSCRRTCAECPSNEECIRMGCCEVNGEQWVACVRRCVTP